MKRNIKTIIDNNLYVLKYLRKNCKFYCVFSIGFTIFSSVYSYFSIQLSRILVNSIIAKASFDIVIRILVVQGILGVIYSFCNSYYTILLSPIAGETLHFQMQLKIFERIRCQKLSVFSETAFFDKINIAIHNADSRALICFSILMKILKSIIEVLLICGLIISLNPILLCLIFFQAMCLVVLDIFNRKLAYKYDMDTIQPKRGRAYVSRMYYLRDNIKEVLSTKIYEVLDDKYASLTNTIVRIKKKYAKKLLSISGIQTVVQHMSSFGISLILVEKTIKDQLMLGDLIAGISAANKVTSSINSFFEEIPKLYENSLYISHYKDFVETKDNNPTDKVNDKYTVTNSVPFLQMKNVSFTYVTNKSQVMAVENIDLVVNKCLNAIVGENGAGKSTVVALLSGLLLPDKGEVILHKCHSTEYSWEDSWKENVCSVFQDAKLFAASIAENVLMRRVVTPNDRILVENALKKANIWEKVLCLPKGIDTAINSEFDDGAIFSGGEQQKIILARIFANKAPIVILDEAFVSLDGINETVIWDNLIDRLKCSYSFIVTHDYKHNSEMDQIIVMKDGRIHSQGKHKDLLVNDRYYSWLFKSGSDGKGGHYAESE